MSGSSTTYHNHAPLKLEEDLVVGHIRWSREFGLPDGDLTKAFVIMCHTVDREVVGSGAAAQEHLVNIPHHVDAWVGPHDTEFYRISFMTFATKPKHWEDKEWDGRATANYLTVSFQNDMTWKGGTDIKIIYPSEIVFGPPGQAQLLHDVQVIGSHSKYYR